MRGGGSFTNPPKRIVVPADGQGSGDPYIIIAGFSDQHGNNFAAIIFRTPTLPPTWEYRLQIREGTSPFDAQFELVLWDTATDDQVSRLITSNYDDNLGTVSTVVGPRFDDPYIGQSTYVWSHEQMYLETFNNADNGYMQLSSNEIALEGQSLPSSSPLRVLNIGQFNFASDIVKIRRNNRQLGFSHMEVNQTPPPADTETSSSFQLIAGATAGTFVKEYDETIVKLWMGMGLFATAGGTTAQYGLRVTPNPSTGTGSRDITIGQTLMSTSNVEVEPSAVTNDNKTLWLPGTYTLEPIWKRTGGAGTLTTNVATGTLSYSAEEMFGD